MNTSALQSRQKLLAHLSWKCAGQFVPAILELIHIHEVSEHDHKHHQPHHGKYMPQEMRLVFRSVVQQDQPKRTEDAHAANEIPLCTILVYATSIENVCDLATSADPCGAP